MREKKKNVLLYEQEDEFPNDRSAIRWSYQKNMKFNTLLFSFNWL